MIRYTLKCAQDHDFDSWFASAEAFAALQAQGRIGCPVCGSDQVEKALMAPAVRPARKGAPAPDAKGALSRPASDVEAALAQMRREVEENSEYVGVNFVTEARAMHDGDAPERPIYGEAKVDEARALIEDGVPIAPLPFMPPRKVN